MAPRQRSRRQQARSYWLGSLCGGPIGPRIVCLAAVAAATPAAPASRANERRPSAKPLSSHKPAVPRLAGRPRFQHLTPAAPLRRVRGVGLIAGLPNFAAAAPFSPPLSRRLPSPRGSCVLNRPRRCGGPPSASPSLARRSGRPFALLARLLLASLCLSRVGGLVACFLVVVSRLYVPSVLDCCRNSPLVSLS